MSKARFKEPKKRWMAVVQLASGLAIVIGVFSIAVAMTRQPPVFDVQSFALKHGIDTSGLFYTDMEEFARAEEWMVNHLQNHGNIKTNQWRNEL